MKAPGNRSDGVGYIKIFLFYQKSDSTATLFLYFFITDSDWFRVQSSRFKGYPASSFSIWDFGLRISD
jgi:hypothetical protein